jgi:cold shock protein
MIKRTKHLLIILGLFFALLLPISASATEQGIVRWFDAKVGYGFVKPKTGSEEIFVHFSAIEGDAKSLRAGQQVLFKVKSDDKKQAAWVKIIQGDQVASR